MADGKTSLGNKVGVISLKTVEICDESLYRVIYTTHLKWIYYKKHIDERFIDRIIKLWIIIGRDVALVSIYNLWRHAKSENFLSALFQQPSKPVASTVIIKYGEAQQVIIGDLRS